MKKKRFSESQMINILKETESGAMMPDLCRLHGWSTNIPILQFLHLLSNYPTKLKTNTPYKTYPIRYLYKLIES
ncbi:transposase [Brumicola nitratireducens]|uniref:transposase n=1 Tax=Brumicola nitratireducens TaxID=300231 RepID=UPI0011D2123A|nr:transposase [Glaciecola nitratireducens]